MKTIVSLSGGMDSCTVLVKVLDMGHEAIAVHAQYGSKHNEHERKMALAFAAHYGVPVKEIDLAPIVGNFKSDLLQSGGDIPEGHYTDESMSSTVVPSRNIIFLSILSGIAWSEGAENLAIGIHQGDHAIYPDCRLEFFKAMDTALYLGTGGRVQILAPFVETDKEGILKWGISHGVPYNLTRTCYKDQPVSCGRCGSCVERLEAFERIGMPDPVEYE